MELFGSKEPTTFEKFKMGKKQLIRFKRFHVFVVDLETIISIKNSDWLLIWSLVVVHLSNYFFFIIFFLASLKRAKLREAP